MGCIGRKDSVQKPRRPCHAFSGLEWSVKVSLSRFVRIDTMDVSSCLLHVCTVGNETWIRVSVRKKADTVHLGALQTAQLCIQVRMPFDNISLESISNTPCLSSFPGILPKFVVTPTKPLSWCSRNGDRSRRLPAEGHRSH